jgi:hypothetical protein
VSRTIGGVALCILAGLMLLGFAQVGSVTLASLIALAIGAGIPGAIGIALLMGRLDRGRNLAASKATLRRQTIEAEILALAGRRGGKITMVEVVTETALADAEASEVLESLAVRGLADIQITDSGTIVYDFRDVRLLGEKGSAKDVLE